MIPRLSQKLNAKIKAGKLTEMPLDENPYADWSSHLFTAARTQYIILTNTPSLYSCVMYGRGITDDSTFIDRALDTIREFTADDGQTTGNSSSTASSLHQRARLSRSPRHSIGR